MTTSSTIDRTRTPAEARVLRLGCVRYLNTLPLIEGLDHWRHVALQLSAPADLIGLLLDGSIDLGLISMIDYQRSPEPLALLPVGMIACDGPTMTVRVYSKPPIEELTVIHADPESHTAAALMQIILSERFGISPEIIPFESGRPLTGQAGSSVQAMLLIGDKVVEGAPSRLSFPHQLDLGQEWKSLTGMPFVYAMWMARRSDLDQPWLRTAVSVLDRQRRRNAMRLDWIASTHASAHGWQVDQARHYLVDLLRFAPRAEHLASIERFFELAQTNELIHQRRELVLAEI